MQSLDIRDMIRHHAEQLDAESPPVAFGELHPPVEDRIRALPTRRPGAVRGAMVAAAVALGIMVFFGGGALLLTLFSGDTGPADEPIPSSVVTTVPDTTLPSPSTTPVPTPTVPPVELPSAWTRIETDMISGAIAAGPDGFVAIGAHPANGLWFSEDGEAWTHQLSLEEGSGGDIAFGPDGYVATVQGSVEWGVGIWLSPDGSDWVAADSVQDGAGIAEYSDSGDAMPGIFADMYGVTYGAGRYVGVGEVWDFDDGPSNPRAAVWTSLDGSVWTRVADNAVFDGPYWQVMESVTFGADGFVAVGWDTSSDGEYFAGAIWRSLDGLDWVRVPHDDKLFGDYTDWTDELNDVTYGDSGYIATGSLGVLVSVDGLSWERVEDPVLDGSYGFGDVTFGGGVYVIVGSEWSDELATAAAWYSTDTTTWTRVPHQDDVFGPLAATRAASVAFHGSRFIAVGSDRTEGETITEHGYIWIGQPVGD